MQIYVNIDPCMKISDFESHHTFCAFFNVLTSLSWKIFQGHLAQELGRLIGGFALHNIDQGPIIRFRQQQRNFLWIF